MQISAAVLMVAGAALVVAAIYAFVVARFRRRTQDLGVISSQWIAQHRASSQDPNR
jgi:hypothetical protein